MCGYRRLVVHVDVRDDLDDDGLLDHLEHEISELIDQETTDDGALVIDCASWVETGR